MQKGFNSTWTRKIPHYSKANRLSPPTISIKSSLLVVRRNSSVRMWTNREIVFHIWRKTQVRCRRPHHASHRLTMWRHRWIATACCQDWPLYTWEAAWPIPLRPMRLMRFCNTRGSRYESWTLSKVRKRNNKNIMQPCSPLSRRGHL